VRWSEFKEEVDKRLKMLGDKDPPIFVIDISGFGADGNAEDINVSLSNSCKTLYIDC